MKNKLSLQKQKEVEYESKVAKLEAELEQFGNGSQSEYVCHLLTCLQIAIPW